jgi:trehalose synthase-fused probable maltokinase
VTRPSVEALAAWLPEQRCFAGKARRIEALSVEASIPLGGAALLIARVRLDDGTDDRYAIPLRATPRPADALGDPDVARALLDLMATGGRLEGEGGAIGGRSTLLFPSPLPAALPLRKVGGEQSNTSIAIGEILVLKQFRRLLPGINPEEEITRFLTERTAFRHAPRLLGSLVYESPHTGAATLAVAHELIADAEDGWGWMLARLRALTPQASAATLAVLGRLGERVGQLHTALASDPGDPDFAPEPITDADLRRWSGDVHAQLAAARDALGGRLPIEPPDIAPALAELRGAMKIRHHGDLHLGQTLVLPPDPDHDVMLVDFEGEPLRPLAERRRKHAAMRDVAGLLRSISYAAAAEDGPQGAGPREAWATAGARTFTAGYLSSSAGRGFRPSTLPGFARAVAAFELEKAAYEVVYEARHRPAWLPIPVRGLVSAAARLRAAASSAGA